MHSKIGLTTESDYISPNKYEATTNDSSNKKPTKSSIKCVCEGNTYTISSAQPTCAMETNETVQGRKGNVIFGSIIEEKVKEIAVISLNRGVTYVMERKANA